MNAVRDDACAAACAARMRRSAREGVDVIPGLSVISIISRFDTRPISTKSMHSRNPIHLCKVYWG